MNAWHGAILAIVGMLTGVLLVLAMQLVLTLRATRRLLEELAPDMKKTARETAALAENLSQLSAPLADQGVGLARFLAALDRMAGTVDRLNQMAQTVGMVAAAVAPAVAAAIKALRQDQPQDPRAGCCEGEEGEGGAGAEDLDGNGENQGDHRD